MINASNFLSTVWPIFKMMLLLLLLLLMMMLMMMYRQASGIKISEQTNPPNPTKSVTKAYSTVLCVLNKWS